MSYEYDLAGNRTRVADLNGGTNDFTFDELNRLTGEVTGQASPSPATTYAYDPAGNLTSTGTAARVGDRLTCPTRQVPVPVAK